MSLIGIDFGTLYSRAAHFGVKGTPEIIRDPGYPESTALLPSLVTFHEEGGVSVGWDAKKKRAFFPLSTVASVKKRIYRPESAQVNEGDFLILPEGKLGTIEKISVILFKEIRHQVENAIKKNCWETALSVPFCFGPGERNFLEVTARAAGFNLIKLIQDTSAAALACSFLEKRTGKLAIFSMGAGFFEFSIFDLKAKQVALLASGGDMIGGADMDWRIAQNLFAELEQTSSQQVKRDPFLVQRVLEESEKAKSALSHRGSFDFQIEDTAAGVRFSRALSRFELTQWLHEPVEKTVGICEHVLKAAGLKHQEIDDVVLAGGAARMPLVQETVERIFHKKTHMEINPDLAVVFGASIYAEMLSGKISGWTLNF